jgi:hypothetical protein
VEYWFPHASHLYMLALLCDFKWAPNFLFSVNAASHISHVYFDWVSWVTGILTLCRVFSFCRENMLVGVPLLDYLGTFDNLVRIIFF